MSEEQYSFTVIDLLTGDEADTQAIALSEAWAKNLIYCDIEGFMLMQDGSLVLADEAGAWAYCPPNRFKIVWTHKS